MVIIFPNQNQNVSQANRLYCSWYKGHSEEKKFRCRSNDFNTHFNSGSMGITGPITWNIGCLKFYNMGILKEKLVAVVLVTKLCLTLCDPVDCSPPVFSVLGILQARIVKWGAIPFSRGIFLTHRSNPFSVIFFQTQTQTFYPRINYIEIISERITIHFNIECGRIIE